MKHVRTVRSKLLAIVALCLVPTALATLVLSIAVQREQRADLANQMGGAERAFNAQLDDDVTTLSVAARLIADDPDLATEVRTGDRVHLAGHVADFSSVFPHVRVELLDAKRVVVASSDRRERGRALKGDPGIERAFAGGSFEGLANGDRAHGYELAVVQAILPGPAGAVRATLRLDNAYLDRVEQKIGMKLALRTGHTIVAATTDHPEPLASLEGARDFRDAANGRRYALATFVPRRLAADGVDAVAAYDITELTRDERRFLVYRLLVLLGVALVAVAAAAYVASRMHASVSALARALPQLAARKYELAVVVPTGDELQRLAESFNTMLAQLKEGELWRRALGKYLSRAALDAVKRGDLKLGGTTLPATVLFSDIRGFTALAEHMPPERVLTLLNRYFTEMVACVFAHGGIVDKFIGDAIMAVWGPPQGAPDDALNAVRAASAMRERLATLNVEFAASGFPQLKIGIGIHCGPVVAGNMGAEGDDFTIDDVAEPAAGAAPHSGAKMEYTVIGDTVNLASRLESATKELHADIVLSEDVYRLVEPRVEVELLSRLNIRGREQAVQVYRLVALRPPPV